MILRLCATLKILSLRSLKAEISASGGSEQLVSTKMKRGNYPVSDIQDMIKGEE